MDELPMTGRAPLDHTGGIALWRQIVHAIEQDVIDGTLAPRARLPTEAELSVHFGVNRHTVRRALEELSRAGMVQVEQGRGSFVAEDVLDYAISARTRFSEWIRAHNKEPGGHMLDLRELAADAATAAGLGLAAGAPVVRMQRLGLADGRPVSLADHHFSAVRIPGLLAALREHQTVTAALAAVGVRDYRRQQTRVSARMPQGNEAELLRMARNRPLLVTESVNVDASGTVVEFGVTRYPTPRVQIVFES
jgi:GntR family phosphonate transport system transcriptional regulator